MNGTKRKKKKKRSSSPSSNDDYNDRELELVASMNEPSNPVI